jgi:hypothetical protein
MQKLKIILLLILISFGSNLHAQCSSCSPGGSYNFTTNTIISSSVCYTSVSMANNILVTVQSGDTLTVCGDWTGNNGDGITVDNGGTLIITGNLIINNAFSLSSNGSVSIGSITMNNSSSLSVGGSGSLIVSGDVSAGNSATLNVSTGGNFDIGGNLSVGTGSTITANGTLDVTGTITGAQPTGSSVQFRSFQTGGWNTSSTWEYSTNGTTWYSAISTPTSSHGTIAVRSGHTVTISSNITIDQTTIDSGGKLILSGGTLTVANGADAQDLIINGTYERTASATNMTPTGVVFCGNGGKYIHNVNLGTLPTISWDANSTLQIDQSLSDNEFTETFGHVVINGSSSFPMYNSSSVTTMNIAGNLTFNSTGTVYIAGPNCNATQTLNVTGNYIHTGSGSFICRKYMANLTLNISGNFTQSNGIFTLGAPSGTFNYNGTINLTGNLNITAGQFNIHKSNGSSSSINNTVNVNGNFEMSGGGLLFSDETGASISSNSVYALLNVKGNFTHTAGTISETASDVDVITRISLNGTSGNQTLESTGQTGTIAFNVAGSGAQSVVSANKTFVQSANASFVIAAGASTPDYVINGTHRRTGTTFTKTGTMSVSSGGTYEHNCNGQAIPTASWDAASNCNITGTSSTTPTNFIQTFGNVTVNCSGTTTIDANFTIAGKLTVTAGTFNQSVYNVTVKGDFTNNGTFTSGTGTTIFNGTAAQTISGSSNTTFNNLTLNNATGLTVSKGITINGTLTFTAGNITAASSSEAVTFGTSGIASGAADTKCIVGYCKKNTNSTTKFTFPVGTSSLYRYASITPSSTSATTWTTKYFGVGYGDYTVTGSLLHHPSSKEYWTIDRSGSANSTIELSWGSNSSVDADYADIVVVHYDGADWESAGGNNISGTMSSGVVSSNSNWSSYSPFTLGSKTGIVPLPIELISFTAKPYQKDVKVTWQTASEIDNDYFIVERSENGNDFSEIARIDGAGNSSLTINYFTFDTDFKKTVLYYRLKLISFNGEVTYSDIASVDMSQTQNQGVIIMTVNSLGQEVDETAKGIVFDIYSDGTSVKRIQF